MKKIYNYTFQLVCIYILLLSLFSISIININVNYYHTYVQNANQEKAVVSTLLIQSQQDTKTIEEGSINIVEENSSTQQENEVKSTSSEPKENVNIVDTSTFAVLSQETVAISHYGHDCYGCTTGYTASGYYVGDGRIYYNDDMFGSVRIVAADNKYPLGTILRLDYQNIKITAIVLDRGSGIGDGKKFQIDLLTTSENQAETLGIIENTKLEVLRLGY